MKQQNQFRQGDVLIERVDEAPADAVLQKRSKAVVLAHGTATGHHHVLQTKKAVQWWKRGEISGSKEKTPVIGGEVFVMLTDGGRVIHQEHAEIELSSGTYRVIRQREYSPEAIRNVAD
jgi:uncharacterized membrane-anchored protein